MKYHIMQTVVDSKGNRGQIVSMSFVKGRNFYQVLLDKDWDTGRADFYTEDSLMVVNENTDSFIKTGYSS